MGVQMAWKRGILWSIFWVVVAAIIIWQRGLTGFVFNEFKISDYSSFVFPFGLEIPRIFDIVFVVPVAFFVYWLLGSDWEGESTEFTDPRKAPASSDIAIGAIVGMASGFLFWLFSSIIFMIFSGWDIGLNRGLILGFITCFSTVLFFASVKTINEIRDYGEIPCARVIRCFLGASAIVLLFSGITIGFPVGTIVALIFLAVTTALYLLGIGVYLVVSFISYFCSFNSLYDGREEDPDYPAGH